MISNIDDCPSNSRKLYISGNRLPSLRGLPSSLKFLDARDNLLENLDYCPGGLETLYVDRNYIRDISGIAYNLKDFSASDNQIESLIDLPDTVTSLNVMGNPLNSVYRSKSIKSTIEINREILSYGVQEYDTTTGKKRKRSKREIYQEYLKHKSLLVEHTGKQYTASNIYEEYIMHKRQMCELGDSCRAIDKGTEQLIITSGEWIECLLNNIG
jgi:Leucine-rich repeat (LRR) protein